MRALLRGLDGGYAQAGMNIYEPVLVTALGCVLTGCDVGALCCDAEELSAVLRGRLKRLKQKLSGNFATKAPQALTYGAMAYIMNISA